MEGLLSTGPTLSSFLFHPTTSHTNCFINPQPIQSISSDVRRIMDHTLVTMHPDGLETSGQMAYN